MFKLNSKGIGLTYSNVVQQLERRGEGEDNSLWHWPSMKDYFFDKLKALDPSPCRMRIAEEKHQDGSFHYHMYLQWVGRVVEVDHTFFDIDGLHPNIQQLRNPHAWNQYIQKDDDPLEWVVTIYLESDDEGYLTPPEE